MDSVDKKLSLGDCLELFANSKTELTDLDSLVMYANCFNVPASIFLRYAPDSNEKRASFLNGQIQPNIEALSDVEVGYLQILRKILWCFWKNYSRKG